MNVRNNRRDYCFDHQLKAEQPLGVKCWYWICRLCLAACWLSASAVAASDSSEPPGPNDISPQRPSITSPDVTAADALGRPASRFGRKLWRAWISSPETAARPKRQSELRQIIEQVLSVELEPGKPDTQTVAVVESRPTVEFVRTVEPNEPTSGDEPTEQWQSKKVEPNLPETPATDRTGRALNDLLQHPGRVAEPFELAEVLFFAGRMKEAAVFYDEALTRNSNDESWQGQNKAWALFQIANCLRGDDAAKAKQTYQRLIAECPDSLWVDVARARYEMIDWYLKDNLSALIEDNILGASAAGSLEPQSQ
ncbi:MAG: tetratricopeptide repeat protein [Planctomycetota bacterium]